MARLASRPSAGPFRFSPARLRFPAGHPFFEDGDVRRHLHLRGGLSGGGGAEEEEEEEEEGGGGGGSPRGPWADFCCPWAGCGQAFGTLESYEHHYQLLHRHVCSACKRSFPSAHLLDVHILEWHDTLFQLLAEKQNMYPCLVESCAEKFESRKDRKDHLIQIHRYPSDFRFDKPMKSKSSKMMKPPSGDPTVPMDVNVEGCEHSPGDAMEIGPSEAAMDQALQPGMENTLVLPASETRRPRTSPRIFQGGRQREAESSIQRSKTKTTEYFLPGPTTTSECSRTLHHVLLILPSTQPDAAPCAHQGQQSSLQDANKDNLQWPDR